MSNYLYILLFITLFIKTELYAQYQTFIVAPAPFSSGLWDEFSPVLYNGGIVFCANQPDNSIISYNNAQNRLFKIFYVAKKIHKGWKLPKILSKEITTNVNDGPVTFNEKENVMYFSRNNSIENYLKNITDTTNKLGIYSAKLINGIWDEINAFTYNNLLYSFCTPALTPDGGRIYFSSDMPGGMGGMDLYYSDKRNNEWDRPVNMGPVINTSKNESFPFACKSGKLFFASDGHKGLGGKDLFYSQELNGKWIDPFHLDSAINSPADDFGILTDSTFENGYFSTNRRKTDDIFSFSSIRIKFTNCDTLKENNYCFTFYDERQSNDTIPVTYQWDFNDGIKRIGTEVKHCFSGPGKYSVKLSIFDKITGKAIVNQIDYKVDLEKIEQAYINSYNVGIVDKTISFDAGKTSLKGFRIANYLWNFGEGFIQGGQVMSQKFRKKGEYMVQLGLLGEKDSLGMISKTCVMKKIRVYDTIQELALKEKKAIHEIKQKTNTIAEPQKIMQFRIYMMNDLSDKQKEIIKEAFNKAEIWDVKFDKYGIIPESYPFLDKIAGIIKEHSEIRFDMALHSVTEEISDNNIEVSEKRAQELSFYFKNKEIAGDAFSVKGFGLFQPTFQPFVPDSKITNGITELIFMKK